MKSLSLAGILSLSLAATSLYASAAPTHSTHTPPPSATPANAYDYGDALQMAIYYYDIQRSGKLSDPKNNRVSWRSDSLLNDVFASPNGETCPPDSTSCVDLTGGIFEAAAYTRFNYPTAYTANILAWNLYAFADQLNAAKNADGKNQYQHLLANLKWINEYLLRSWDSTNNILYAQIGNAGYAGANGKQANEWYTVGTAFSPELADEVYHELGPKEGYDRVPYYVTAASPGCDLAGAMASAFAASSIVFRGQDDAYAQQLLDAAVSVYNFGTNNLGGKFKDFQSTYSTGMGRYEHGVWVTLYPTNDADKYYASHDSGCAQDLAFAAAWLATAKTKTDPDYNTYIEEAKIFSNFKDTGVPGIGSTTLSWGNKTAGTYLLMLDLLTNTNDRKKYDDELSEWLDVRMQKGNRTTGGLAWFSTSWYGSLRYAMNTAFVAILYDRHHNSTDYEVFAKEQVDYVLGDNPYSEQLGHSFSYLIGYGEHYPQFAMSSVAAGWWKPNMGEDTPNRHILVGGLVGGPMEQTDTNADAYQDDRGENTVYMNEPTQDYSAALVGVLAHFYGTGDTAVLPDLHVETPEQQYAVGVYQEQGQSYEEWGLALNKIIPFNMSSWAPEIILPHENGKANVRMRYFVSQLEGNPDGKIDVWYWSGIGTIAAKMESWGEDNHDIKNNIDALAIDINRLFMPWATDTYSAPLLSIAVACGKGCGDDGYIPDEDWSYITAQTEKPKNDFETKQNACVALYLVDAAGHEKLIAGEEPIPTLAGDDFYPCSANQSSSAK